MAITQTGAIYKSLSFDNTSSRNYGVYITGEAVYNAPERAVEMISIPGRNGAFALDHGRFENIEVTYPAGIFAENETDFAQAISNFRNFLCSKEGYCRLTDEYNPNEYRMAVYKSGLEVEPAQLRAGEFTITFECKPQRWLTSGETATTVANNGTLTNPTLFPSSPLLAVTGYGEIGIGGETIALDNVLVGDVVIASSYTAPNYDNSYGVIEFDDGIGNTGDDIYVRGAQLIYNISSSHVVSGLSCTCGTGGTATIKKTSRMTATVNVYLDDFSFKVGTSSTKLVSFSYTLTTNGYTDTSNASVEVSYVHNNNALDKIMIKMAGTISYMDSIIKKIDAIILDSTKSALGSPTYIDLDIGEAYKIENNNAVSVNNAVRMPSELPTLKAGTTTFTKDNTVTQLKVTPRWWKV